MRKTYSVGDYFPDMSDRSVAFPDSKRVRIKEIFDLPIVITAIRWMKSDSDSPWLNSRGDPRFVVFEFWPEKVWDRFNSDNSGLWSAMATARWARTKDGGLEMKSDQLVFNTHTGAKEVCSRLEELQQKERLPVRGTIILRDEDGSYGLV